MEAGIGLKILAMEPSGIRGVWGHEFRIDSSREKDPWKVYKVVISLHLACHLALDG